MNDLVRSVLSLTILTAVYCMPAATHAGSLNWIVLPSKAAVSETGSTEAPGSTHTTLNDNSTDTSDPVRVQPENVIVEHAAPAEPLIPPAAEPVELLPIAAQQLPDMPEPADHPSQGLLPDDPVQPDPAEIDPAAGSVHDAYVSSGAVIDDSVSTPIIPASEAVLPAYPEAESTGIERKEEDLVRSLLEGEAATAHPSRDDAEATTEAIKQSPQSPEETSTEVLMVEPLVAAIPQTSAAAPAAYPEDDDPESVQEPLPAATAEGKSGTDAVLGSAAVTQTEDEADVQSAPRDNTSEASETLSVLADGTPTPEETAAEATSEDSVAATAGETGATADNTVTGIVNGAVAEEKVAARGPASAVEQPITPEANQTPSSDVPEFTVGDWMLSDSTPDEFDLPQAEDVALIPQPPMQDEVAVMVNVPAVDEPVAQPAKIAVVDGANAPDEVVEQIAPLADEITPLADENGSAGKSLASLTTENGNSAQIPQTPGLDAESKNTGAPAGTEPEPGLAAAEVPQPAAGNLADGNAADIAPGPTSQEMAALEAELDETLELGPVAIADGIEPASASVNGESINGENGDAGNTGVNPDAMVDQIIEANVDEIDAANAAASALPPPMTLVDILERALANNPEVGMALAREEQARWSVKEAGAYRSPTLDLVVEAGPEYNRPATNTSDIEDITPGRNLNMRLTKLLYDGGTSVSEENRRQQIRRTTEIETRLVIEEIVVKAVKAYMQILQNQQAARVADDFVAEMKRMVDQISVMKESGAASKIELDFARSRLASATAQTGTTEAQLNDAIASLEFLTGDLPPFTAVTPMKAGEIQVDTLVSYADRARHNNAEVLLNASNKTALGLKLRGQMAAYKPILTLNMKTEALADEGGNMDPRNTTEAKLKVEYFIIDGGVRKARIQRTKAQLVELEWDHERVVKDVDRRIKQSYNQITTNRLTLSATEDEIRANEELRRLNRKNLEIGEISILELIEVEERLFNSRANRDRIAAEMLRNYYELLIGTGDLPQVLSEEYVASRIEPLDD